MIYDVLVIGGGQAGLAMGYYLKQKKLNFLIFDKGNRIGESWKNRYDSLTLFTPRSYSSLHGLPLKGDEKRYPTKDEIGEYLSAYADTFSLPVELGTYITRLEKADDYFIVTTNKGEFLSKNVIVATGPFQKPNVPEIARHLSSDVLQLHSSEYKNPNQIADGTTLVVGSGNSGAQIAAEISRERDVHLSVGHKMKFLPQDIGNKSIFWWFDKLGVYRANKDSKVGQFIKNWPDPIFGFELKEQIKNKKVNLRPRTISAEGTRVQFEDGSIFEARNVIWSTGFKSDYSWIHIPSVLLSNGLPIHQRGITPIKGLFFLGLPWIYCRGSALLQGVDGDAKFISEQL